jgi:hypothetical protein
MDVVVSHLRTAIAMATFAARQRITPGAAGRAAA